MNLSLTLLIARACHQHSCRLQSHVREAICTVACSPPVPKLRHWLWNFSAGYSTLSSLEKRRYSFNQRRQNTFTMYCTWRHHCRKHRVGHLILSIVTVDGWGSRAGYLGDRLTIDLVIGLPLTTDSTSHIRVLSDSSSNCCSFRVAKTTFLTVRMHLSHTPPWWDPAGGSKVHLTFCCRELRVYVFDSSHSLLAWVPSLLLRTSLHCPSVFLRVDLFVQWNV